MDNAGVSSNFLAFMRYQDETYDPVEAAAQHRRDLELLRELRGEHDEKEEPHRRAGKKRSLPYQRKKPEYAAYDPKRYSDNRICCKNTCYTFWDGKEADIAVIREGIDPEWDAARKRAYVDSYRAILSGRTEKRACDKWVMCVFGIRSKDKLHGKVYKKKKKKTEGELVSVAVLSWFLLILHAADAMPDEDKYILPAPFRKNVLGWYNEDSRQWPELFPPVSPSYFNHIWRTDMSHVVLRKYLRFSKCASCVHWRGIRWARSTPRSRRRRL